MSHNNRERSEKSNHRIAKAAARAVLETMETRRLMSAVTLADGVLTLRGDATTASNFIVDFNAPRGQYRALAGDVEQNVAAAEVTAIHIIGGDGDDHVYVDPYIDVPTVIETGAGDDVIRGGYGADAVDAGAGDDRVYGGRGNDRLLGGAGDDDLYGNQGDDVLDGGDGDDRVYGAEGDDTIYGGAGFDLLVGAGGDDSIHGGGDDDRLDGDGGDDRLFGGEGDDRITGDSGDDEINGGRGSDTLRGGRGSDAVFRDGADGETAPGPHTPGTNPPGPVTRPGNGNTPGNTLGKTPDNTPGNGGGNPGGQPTPDARTPKATIRVIGGSAVVGQGVHVHALESTLNGGSYVTARYEWDFGDVGARYNTLSGFNAAHVYDKPGVYTVTLTLTNELGFSDTETVQVHVAADDRATVYVDSARGKDTNAGDAPDKAVRTAKRAFELAGDDTRILFRRGQRFTVTDDLDVRSDRVLVGAYGTGELPLLYRVEGGDKNMIVVNRSASNVTIQDLAFDAYGGVDDDEEAPKIRANALHVGGTNVVVRDVEFRNIDCGVEASMQPTGLLVMDTVATKSYGLRSYHVWGEGTDHVYLGNVSPNSTREHNVRTSGVERVLVAFNDFANRERPGVDDGDISKGCIEIHRGLFSYVASNTVHDGVIRFGPRGGEYEGPETRTDWNVVENNRLDDVGIQLYPGTHHTMIRNNVIERYRSVRHSAAIQISQPDSDGRTSSDVYILNNTAIDTRSHGAFLRVRGKVDGGITLKNNLWVYDKLRIGADGSAAVYVRNGDLSDFREISGNVWPVPASASKWATGGGANFVSDEWGKAGSYLTAEQWNDSEQVGTDVFQNVEPNDVYRVKLGDIVAGSTLAKAA